MPFPPPPPKKQGWPWESDEILPPSERAPSHCVVNPHPPARDALPFITVVTPSFNQGQYLEETIRSVLLQDYPNLQFIVVDGASTDDSAAIIERYRPWIDHVIIEPDDGQSDAICKGLDRATGDWFNWINSDDALAPGVLWQIAKRGKPNVDLLTFPVEVRGGDPPSPPMHNQNLSALAMLRCDRYSFAQPGCWFRIEHLKAIGGIDRQFNYGFDWDLLVRYLASFPTVVNDTTTGAMFRLHEQSKTVIETGKTNGLDNRFRIENDKIREKLERTLPKRLVAASRLGRRRQPWNQWMIERLDETNRSPIGVTCEIMRETLRDPGARWSGRTLGSIARLLSRYIRPKFYR